MPVYSYKARDKFGKLVSSNLTVPSVDAVISQLREFGYVPITIQQIKSENKASVASVNLFANIKPAEINMFTRQFYVLQKAGLPLVRALDGLAEQNQNPLFRKILTQISVDVQEGSKLYKAMARYPKIFSKIYVNMIRAGEASGTLEENLESLNRLLEYETKMAGKIKQATRYPLIVLAVMAAGFFVLTALIIPRFATLYAQFKTQLPLPTRILLGINYAVTKGWWMTTIAGTAIFILSKMLLKTDVGRYWWDDCKLHVPIFGKLILNITMARFARTTGLLMRSGIPIVEILDLVAEGVGNVVVSEKIGKVRLGVIEGKGIYEPLKSVGLFPPAVVNMVAVGEETGKVDELLTYVADYYDMEAEYISNNLVVLIEPVLVIVLGTGVLGLALGLFMPLWNMMSLFIKR